MVEKTNNSARQFIFRLFCLLSDNRGPITDTSINVAARHCRKRKGEKKEKKKEKKKKQR
jgi:hypothetical protein